ncbi:MAG: S9 family peptidase [Steroidobacteraceae bacterium]|nr:S9 family peptidase [Steroidobacteraceae bacterium]
MTARLTAPCALLILSGFVSTLADAEMLTIERMFAAPDLSGASLRNPRISPDGRYVAYLRGGEENKDRLDLWAFDVPAKKHTRLVEAARLVPKERPLSAEEEQRRERQRTSSLSGILEYEFSPDSRLLLVPLGGDLYVYDLRAKPESAVRRITTTESFETDAHFSPGGRYVSFIRDQNLVVYDLTSGTERQITRDGGGLVSYGTAEFIAQEEMNRDTGYWWSPDDRRIAFTRVDESPVAEVERFEIYADEVKVVKQRYPAAGARNALVQLFVAELEGDDRAVQMDLGADPDIYLARVDWFPDGNTLAVQRQSRDQKTLSLLRLDARSGRATELVTERSDTWVDLNSELTLLKSSPQFIWASRRTGHTHLYLYGNDGKLVRALTQGDWDVVGDAGERAIRGVDERNGIVYFVANAETPLERHLYSVSLDGKAVPKKITQDAGWHSITMSRDARVFLDTFSTPERPPSLTLRSARGDTLSVLVENALTSEHPYAPYVSEHVPTEFGTLKARDGQTLYYQLLKPRNLVPGERYPVIVDVYGGPGVQRVRRAWGGYPRGNEGFFRQYLVQHGYVVFTLDNRGSGFRGVQFESALYKHMGSVEVQDQVTGVEFLKTLPYVDPSRIGVFGWSYGGYMALMCMMQAPDIFAAGVAGAPVTDWRLYDTHYTERFMSTPQENPEGYKSGNVLTYAPNLRGPLLIMHGMADDNVLFTHSTALFKRLQDLNKPFDMMTYPGSKHGMLRHADTGPHAYHTITRFFDTHLKPQTRTPTALPTSSLQRTP